VRPPGEPRRPPEPDLLLIAPLRLEVSALRSAGPRALVARSGMGPARARRFGARARRLPGRAVAIAGFGGALTQIAPGELLVAEGLIGEGDSLVLPEGQRVAANLRAAGLRVHLGAIVTTSRLVGRRGRRRLARTGARGVDMESLWLANASEGRPLAVVRAVVDAPGRELYRPLMTVTGALHPRRALARAGPVLVQWAAEAATRSTS
jgi:4-hydroxy-3-methylbut-2-enyl diphosphate reductase